MEVVHQCEDGEWCTSVKIQLGAPVSRWRVVHQCQDDNFSGGIEHLVSLGCGGINNSIVVGLLSKVPAAVAQS